VDVISTRDLRNFAAYNNSITYFEGKPYNSTNSMLPESTGADVGTELKHKDNLIVTNHDIYGTKFSAHSNWEGQHNTNQQLLEEFNNHPRLNSS
jgi:hypothetical protein